MSKHTAIYTRVSTDQQDASSQELALKKWAECQDEAVVWYSDKASGTKMVRTQLNRMLGRESDRDSR
jgi:DNA invertase Pin-like site-specific DNA recombinase